MRNLCLGRDGKGEDVLSNGCSNGSLDHRHTRASTSQDHTRDIVLQKQSGVALLQKGRIEQTKVISALANASEIGLTKRPVRSRHALSNSDLETFDR